MFTLLIAVLLWQGFFRISLFSKKLDYTIVRYDIVLSMLSEVEFDSIGCYFVASVKRILMDFNALKILWTRKHSSRMRTARFSGPRVCPIPLESDPSLNTYPPGGWPPPLEGTWAAVNTGRIQDFREGPILWQNFTKNCMKMKEIGLSWSARVAYLLGSAYEILSHRNSTSFIKKLARSPASGYRLV